MAITKQTREKKNSKHSPTSDVGNQKSASPKAANTQTSKKRALKGKQYRSFRLSKALKHTAPKLASGRGIARRAVVLMWHNKKVIGGVLLIYALLQLFLVRGLIATDFTTLSDIFKETFGPGWAEFVGSVALLGILVGGSGQSIPAEGSVYLSILSVIGSLAMVWTLRHLYAQKAIRIRDAYYKGMYPLVPLLLLLALALIQLLPLAFGSWLYQAIIVNGLAVTLFEQLFWLIIVGFFALFSFYMLMNTVIALYIVTLPGMEPMRALRSAKGIVQHRRLQVFWRILFLVIIIVVSMAALLIPVIMFVPGLAPWLFYALSIMSFAFVHAYMYGLYRELLRES